MHCALLLAVVMISLAVLYAVQDAPFLFAVQIIVYTGAILMLFLFVLMLVGVDSSDSVVETIRGQRLFAALVGLVFGATLVIGVAQVSVGAVAGLDQANEDGNVPAIAQMLFTQYVFAFEVTSALLITAALGAMVLAHRERLTPKPTQARRRPPSGCATTPTTASTSARCPHPASSPGTTRSTPRRCCPTARPPSPRSPACSPPAARSSTSPGSATEVERDRRRRRDRARRVTTPRQGGAGR